jgi:hypothetical protein
MLKIKVLNYLLHWLQLMSKIFNLRCNSLITLPPCNVCLSSCNKSDFEQFLCYIL